MNISLSRLIIGLIFLVAGVIFIILAIFTSWWMLFYGIPLLILGIVILLNKNEDKIEKRKDLKEKDIQNNMAKEIIVTTAFEVPNRKIAKVLGIARGNTVRSKNIGRDIAAGLKSIVGGEVKTFTEMTAQSRDEALNRMINDAIKMGADAIIGFRFTSSTVMKMSAEILAYGTAVKLK